MSISMPRRATSFDGGFQNRQRLQAEEVELHQPRLLDPFHVELGDRHVGARIAIERDQFGQRPVADDDAGGVRRGVAVEPFELLGDVEQVRDDRLLLDLLQRGSAAIASFSLTGLAGFAGTSLQSRSTCP
jgi:hypothetical protein